MSTPREQNQPCDADAPPDLSAVFAEAERRKGADEAQRATDHTARETEFHARLERMIGDREWNPGDGAGVKCKACGREYVFSDARRIVHAPGGCTPKHASPLAAPDLMERVRRAFDPSEEDED